MSLKQEYEPLRRKPKVLLCLTGSVAVVNAPQLVVTLSEFAEVLKMASNG